MDRSGLKHWPGVGVTLSVNVTGATFSGAGPTFPNSMLTTGTNFDGVGSQDGFLATITATASTQPDAYSLPNHMTSLNLKQVSVWAAKHFSYASTNPGFVETTLGNTGASDLMTTINTISDVTNAGSYTQLIWNAFDADSLDPYQVSGLSVKRTFALISTFTGSNYYLVDGFEALGNISLSYDIAIAPEPSSGMMFAVVLGTLWNARRKKPRSMV